MVQNYSYLQIFSYWQNVAGIVSDCRFPPPCPTIEFQFLSMGVVCLVLVEMVKLTQGSDFPLAVTTNVQTNFYRYIKAISRLRFLCKRVEVKSLNIYTMYGLNEERGTRSLLWKKRHLFRNVFEQDSQWRIVALREALG